MMVCVFSSVEGTENQPTSNVKIGLNEKNIVKVKADYVVTIKSSVPVYYKVKTKVKVAVRYKSRGKWKTKYKYVYKYVYKVKYYKTVYNSYNVRDIPPGECTGPTANSQSNDPRIISLAQSLTNSTVNETVSNPNKRPSQPNQTDYINMTAYNEAYGAWNNSKPNSSNYTNITAYNAALDAWNSSKPTSDNYTDKDAYNAALDAYNNYNDTVTMIRNLTTMEKASNIFYWVRDNTDYSFYYNTMRGAIGTLNDRLGNCVDLSHLIVALSRAAGIPARYMNGDCNFNSGTIGHVWAQLYVDGVWINADASNNINDFGIIRNWNTANYILKGIYSSLPF
ncbi:MAG TPA: transglutaminase-like domain-containing protein [Methanobacterium sp.]|nr:transglutaminase-like domain-containing protein [Methanobacterium sp.]